MVGFISLNIFWRQRLQDILPATARGVVVVFSSPCNPSFTFQVNGPDVEYLGRGDLHDTKYNDMEMTSSLLDLSDLASGDSFYSGVPINDEFCPFMIRVYPSQLKEDDYTSVEPVIFSVIVAGIFLFTSLVFVCYDNMVEMRQRRVMNQAVQSSDLVASLFPKEIRDRLYQEAEAKKQAEKEKNSFRARLDGLQSSSHHDNNMLSLMKAPSQHKLVDIQSQPIADLCK